MKCAGDGRRTGWNQSFTLIVSRSRLLLVVKNEAARERSVVNVDELEAGKMGRMKAGSLPGDEMLKGGTMG